MRIPAIALMLLFVFTGFAFGQAASAPVTVAFPQIAVGGDPAGQNYVTIVQIANNNSTTITAHIAIYGDTGSALGVSFDGQANQSTLDLTLNAGATRQMQLALSGDITTGWMEITYSPSDALTTVILQFRSGSTLLSEVGVDPVFNAVTATDFASETDLSLNTGIAIANPTTGTAYILASVWDPGTGTIVASNVVSVQANGHVARLVTELFPNVIGTFQTRVKISLDSCSSSACSFTGPGFLATAIRLNGPQFTTIPVAQRPTPGTPLDQVRVLPQVAFGGPSNGLNMKTVLYFTTNVATGVFGTADIFDNNGNPLAASADGGAPSSSITFTVPGNRVTRLVLSGDQTLRSGWIRLTLSGSVHLVTSAVFQTFVGSDLTAEASVLESQPTNTGLIYVKVVPGAANVGVAVANSGASDNTITVTLFNRDGFVTASKNVTLAANGHLAMFATELFPEIASADFDGALSIHSDTEFEALALRLSGDKLATLPISSDGMYRPTITGLRVTGVQRSPAQVTFEIDVTDFDSDLVTAASTSVTAIAVVDFGSSVGYDSALITIDGSGVLNRATGTLRGTFKPPNVTSAVPSGFSAVFYIVVYDAAGNASNFIGIPIRF